MKSTASEPGLRENSIETYFIRENTFLNLNADSISPIKSAPVEGHG